MFMATNQVEIVGGCEKTFEVVYELTLENLREAAGFLGSRIERGPTKGGRSLYFVITIWAREADFLSWRCVEMYGGRLRAALRKDDLDLAVSRDNPQ